MTWDGRAPFDPRTGSLLAGTPYVHPFAPVDMSRLVEWRDAGSFEATLEFVSLDRYALFRDPATGATYPMFVRDFADIVPALMDGWVRGIWTVRKRGMRYGVVPVDAGRRKAA